MCGLKEGIFKLEWVKEADGDMYNHIYAVFSLQRVLSVGLGRPGNL